MACRNITALIAATFGKYVIKFPALTGIFHLRLVRVRWTLISATRLVGGMNAKSQVRPVSRPEYSGGRSLHKNRKFLHFIQLLAWGFDL